MWLFGGFIKSGANDFMPLNDFWRFDGTNWAWISGDIPSSYLLSVQGPLNEYDPNVSPGGRYGAVLFSAKEDEFWLYGGYGFNPQGSRMCFNSFSDKATGEYLDEMWKFNGTYWAYLGSQYDVGSRYQPFTWSVQNTLWMYGGERVEGNLPLGDFWKFTDSVWTQISTDADAPVYGIKGVADSLNNPGRRFGGNTWVDHFGNLWMFGGDNSSSTILHENFNI